MPRINAKKRRLSLQPLESRRVLAASLGWDGPGQGSAELSYYIANSPSSLTQEETNAAIQTALAAWSSAADITFTQVNQPGLRDSIDISFTNIDGAGRTLAQAYFPDDVNPARIAGDIQFDISEAWEVGNSLASRAFDLVYVAVHEIGHSLGLDHTDAGGSVLAPSVSPNQSFTSLSATDASAIQSLYAPASGANTTSTTTTPTTTVPAEDPVAETPTTTTDPGDSDSDPFPRNRWRRGGNWHRFGGRLDADVPEGNNYIIPTDVNGDSNTSAADALMIINELNRLANSDSTESSGLCDTNADGSVTAADALMVINVMNNSSATSLLAVVSNTDITTVGTSDSDTTTIDPVDETPVSVLTDPAEEMPVDQPTDPVDETPVDQPVDTPMDPVVDPPTSVDPGDTTVDPGNDTNPIDPDPTMPTDSMDPIDDGGVTDNDDRNGQDCHNGERHGEPLAHVGPLAIGILGKNAEDIFARFDTNSDGSITEAEVMSRLWTALQTLNVDNNNDGSITLEEVTTAIDAAQQAKFDAKDTDSDGLLTETEVGTRAWAHISAADTNADSAVSFDELQTFLQDQSPTGNTPVQHHEHHLRVIDQVFAQFARPRLISALGRGRR